MINKDYLKARGFLTVDERNALRQLATYVPPNGNILNIGVEYGASIVCLRNGNPTAALYGVDINNSKCEVSELATKLITTRSQDLVKTWYLPLDLVFIDGEHTKEAVLSDLGFAELVPVNGLVALHDCNDGLTHLPHGVVPEVNDAVEVWAKEHPEWVEVQHVDSLRVFKRGEKKAHGTADPINPPANVQPSGDTGTGRKRLKYKPEI